MASHLSVTTEELLAALVDESSAPENARTTVEIMEETGLCRKTVTQALRRIHREGRLVAHQVKRTSFDGKTRPVSAYTVLPKRA